MQPRLGAAKRGQPCYYLLRARPRAPGCASCWQCALKSCSQRPLRAATSMIIRLAVASLMVASAAGAFFGDAAPRRAPGVSRAAVAAHSVRGGAAPRCEAASAAAEEEIPPLASRPRRRVALLVEPTPFTHVSGYSNRFREMLRFLKEGGDVAEVTTADDTPARPDDFMGMPIRYVPGFRLPLYKQVQLTVDFGFGGLRMLQARAARNSARAILRRAILRRNSAQFSDASPPRARSRSNRRSSTRRRPASSASSRSSTRAFSACRWCSRTTPTCRSTPIATCRGRCSTSWRAG